MLLRRLTAHRCYSRSDPNWCGRRPTELKSDIQYGAVTVSSNSASMSSMIIDLVDNTYSK